MDKNIIKENLTSVLFVVIALSAGFIYLITEYKDLETKRSSLEKEYTKEKMNINNQKNDIKLMQKDLENKISQDKIKYNHNSINMKNLQNKRTNSKN